MVKIYICRTIKTTENSWYENVVRFIQYHFNTPENNVNKIMGELIILYILLKLLSILTTDSIKSFF